MVKAKPIVVVGSINMDLVATAERIPVIGETVSGVDFRTHPGGKGANQAVAVARLGYPVSMIGNVGSDDFGVKLRQGLVDAGVDCTAVRKVPGSSGVALIVVSLRGENSIVVTPGANGLFTPEDVDANMESIRSAGLVLAQLEIPLPAVERLGDLCRSAGVPLILDPAPARPLTPDLLGNVTWLTPNETEAAFYTAADQTGGDVERMMESLLHSGPAGVVLKQGERGVLIADRRELQEKIPAVFVGAVDTTAAGDAFNGAFATALMLGRTPVESARFAVAAAAISVTRHGAQISMPTFAEVEQLILDGQLVGGAG